MKKVSQVIITREYSIRIILLRQENNEKWYNDMHDGKCFCWTILLKQWYDCCHVLKKEDLHVDNDDEDKENDDDDDDEKVDDWVWYY